MTSQFITRIPVATRFILFVLVNMSFFATADAGDAAREGTLDDAEALLERIAASETRADDVQSPDQRRSNALDQSLEAREALLRLEGHVSDPRRPMWLTDQAEALLLKRIEFPSSWSTHLMVAHPSCPLIPPEIPLIVGRGLQKILQAEESITEAIETVEAEERFETDTSLRSLHERLLFERDLRIPLLKAIALTLASRADPSSGREAVEILQSMRAREELLDATREVIDHWFRQALLVTGDRETFRKASATSEPATEDERLRRLREAALLQDEEDVIALGRKMIQELDREQSYEKLLLADIVEESRTIRTDVQPHGDDARNWAEGAGDTWIMLLDDSQQEDDWTLDGPLVARLADLERRHGREGAPLAVLWAAGQKELAGRSRDRVEEPDMLALLQDAALNAANDEPARARTLETAARIAMLEGERLTAAELCEILYLEHPGHPFGGPRLVADLTEPWARAGREEATGRYERALQTIIEKTSPEEAHDDLGLQTLRLAEQYLRRAQPEKSRALLEQFRPASKEEAARFLEACLQEIVLIREIETLSEERVDREYDLLLKNVDRVVGEFGPLDTSIQDAASRARIASLTGRRRLARDSIAIGVVERIIERNDIPAATRIDALFLRHRMKLARVSEREDALVDMPQLLQAVELDPMLAGHALAMTLEERLSRLDSIRDEEIRRSEKEAIIEELRSFARLIDTTLLSTLSMTQKVVMGRSLNEIGLITRSIPLWEAMAGQQPDAWVVMQGRAEALGLSDEIVHLAEAMRLYRRLGQGSPGQNVPEEVWWSAQLGQLLIMEKADRSTEKIPTRIQRLKLIDATLGGEPFQSEFESLLQRMTQKS